MIPENSDFCASRHVTSQNSVVTPTSHHQTTVTVEQALHPQKSVAHFIRRQQSELSDGSGERSQCRRLDSARAGDLDGQAARSLSVDEVSTVLEHTVHVIRRIGGSPVFGLCHRERVHRKLVAARKLFDPVSRHGLCERVLVES